MDFQLLELSLEMYKLWGTAVIIWHGQDNTSYCRDTKYNL